MDAATLTGADNGVDDAANEFLRRMTDKGAPAEGETPPEKEHEETNTDDEVEDTEDTSDETSNEDDEGSEDDQDEDDGDEKDEDEEATEPDSKSKKKVILEAGADAYVKHKVDGKDVEIKVSDLTRLYGQEAALTRKSTEVAELRRATEASSLKYVAGLEQMMERAKARFEPYAKVDWLSISKDPSISPEEARALYAEATKASDDIRYLEQSLDTVVKDIHQQRHNDLVTRGAEAWQARSDPSTGIKGWGEKLYADVTKFAVDNGMDKDVIKNLVDPAAIRLIHKAMLYDKSKTVVTKTSKVNKTPKKIIKETAEPVTAGIKSKKAGDAERRLRDSGSLDDATAAFMERMKL